MGACSTRSAWAAAAGVAAALTLAAPAAGTAQGLTPAQAAKRLPEEVVVVERAMRPRLPTAAAGRLRLRIVDRAIGRVKIAVVSERSLRAAGGAEAYAGAVDRVASGLRGTLIVASATRLQLVTSYPQAEQARRAVQGALAGLRAPLEVRLRATIDTVAAVDPGPSADLGAQARGRPQPSGSTAPDVEIAPPAAQAAEDVLGTLRTILLLVGGSIALLFLMRVGLLVGRAWQGRRERALDVADLREGARERLVAVGDGIRELDVAEGMPGAPPTGRAAYARALDHFERADRLLAGEPGARAVRRAAASLTEAEQALARARAAFGVAVAPL